MIPYFAFNILDCIPRYLFPQLVNGSQSIGQSIKNIFLNGGEYWFLYVLFIMFLIFPLMHKLIKGKPVLQISALVIVLVLRFVPCPIGYFHIGTVIKNLFYFMIGYIIKENFDHRIWNIKLNKALLGGIIATLSMVWLLLIKFLPENFEITPAIIGIFVFYLCVQFSLPTRIFKGFGQYSLQLYLLNGFLLVISRTVIVSILNVTSPTIIIVFNMLVDFFLSYIIIKYICAKIKPAKFLMGIN